ncbi:kinase protein [Phytophthora nicotianae]|uniref:Kinase protein n=1 Tax=Phytophthora nicotianae TaxID=4792 RepID=A0A0W8AZG0_PHYNI|nr:kinase protein [Phytophthora nicotianae]
MEQEWRQVSRRRRGKPRNGASYPRFAASTASKVAANGKNLRTIRIDEFAVGEEEVEPVPEISADKQTKIIGRVRAIADILRDSLLVQDALRVIAEHFELNTVKKSVDKDVEGVDTEEVTDHSPTLVGYGLGSFCASSNAVHQLGFLVALRESLESRLRKSNGDVLAVESSDTIQHCAEIFDPAMNKNVLACNWGPAIKNLVIIGNSFSAYGDRVLGSKERDELLLVSVLPYVDEVPLPCGVAKHHEDFARYEAAFNDLSVLRFPSSSLHRALRDDNLLNEKMATVARTEKPK